MTPKAHGVQASPNELTKEERRWDDDDRWIMMMDGWTDGQMDDDDDDDDDYDDDYDDDDI